MYDLLPAGTLCLEQFQTETLSGKPDDEILYSLHPELGLYGQPKHGPERKS